jgi:hypothetical protein
VQGQTGLYCYECHEELLHNPVFLPKDIEGLAVLVNVRGLAEENKPEDRRRIAGRIELLHDIIEAGIITLTETDRPR